MSSPGAGSTTDELDELTDAFLTSARALVALAVRSINAAPVEVTVMQHRVLVLLAAHREQSVSDLAEQLGVNASNASRVCDRLQRLGLVARHRSAADARSVTVALTPEGMDLLNAVNRFRRKEIRRVLESLTTEVGRDVVEALRTFNDAAHERADTEWIVPGATEEPHPAAARAPGPNRR
jgi:DNA-binding MarR family transcriptional regulator